LRVLAFGCGARGGISDIEGPGWLPGPLRSGRGVIR